ncbi:MAG: hypothetical protein J5608_02360 [Alphaproteobacteria bacterium]|nr:hypothetical protein [Alphaproteobacteria bacterium]
MAKKEQQNELLEYLKKKDRDEIAEGIIGLIIALIIGIWAYNGWVESDKKIDQDIQEIQTQMMLLD